MSSSYYMKQKAFVKASRTNKWYIHWRKGFLQLLLLKFVDHFFSDEVKKRVVYFGLYEPSLHFYW